MTVRKGVIGALAAAITVLVMGPVPTAASPEELPSPTAQQLANAVRRWDPAGSVHRWDPAGSVRSVESVSDEGGVITITLATDILFSSQSDELPASAASRIAGLLVDVPEGATVQVHGHTDSLVGPIPNDELSENRADAVADVISAERTDLDLDVAGFAATQPTVRESNQDPSTYAANRRVEIIYGD